MEKSPDAFRTISEVADLLETPAHVLRFWESRFPQIRPVKRAGGRRYYRPADVALLTGIRRLLHDDGLTIRGVQKILREQGVKHVSGLTEDNDPGAEDAAFVEGDTGILATDTGVAARTTDPIPLFPGMASTQPPASVPAVVPDDWKTPGADSVSVDASPAGPPDPDFPAAAVPVDDLTAANLPEFDPATLAPDEDIRLQVPAFDLPRDATSPEAGDDTGFYLETSLATPAAQIADPQADAAAGPSRWDDAPPPGAAPETSTADPALSDATLADATAGDSAQAADDLVAADDAATGDAAAKASGPDLSDPDLSDPEPLNSEPSASDRSPPAAHALPARPGVLPDLTGLWLPTELRALHSHALSAQREQILPLMRRLQALRDRVGDRGRVPRR